MTSPVRPSVRLEGDERRIDWPVNEVRLGELDDGRPLVTVLGIEPRLRWRTFSQASLTVVNGRRSTFSEDGDHIGRPTNRHSSSGSCGCDWDLK